MDWVDAKALREGCRARSSSAFRTSSASSEDTLTLTTMGATGSPPPAGLPTRWHLDQRGVRHLHLFLDARLLSAAAEDAGFDPARVELVPGIGLRDPHFERIGLDFLAELQSGGAGGRLYADALSTLLAVQLVRRQSSAGPLAPSHPARLSPATLARATEYIEANLAEDLSLAAIADEVGLSRFHLFLVE